MCAESCAVQSSSVLVKRCLRAHDCPPYADTVASSTSISASFDLSAAKSGRRCSHVSRFRMSVASPLTVKCVRKFV